MSPPGKGSGATRGRLQKHIPFRADDLGRGKKTGRTINHVPRDSDDFEPFEQVLAQAYKNDVPRAVNNRPKVVNGKRPRRPSPIPDVRDDSGELSMDIDSAPNSPSAYFNTASAPQPSSARRAGSSSRPLARESNVDYDRVPSPKPVPRRGSAQSHADSHPRNRSGLRNEILDDDETPRGNNADANDDSFGQAADYEGQEDYPDAGDDGPSLHSRGNISFTELAQDDEDSVAERDQSPVLTKGKGRAEVQESDEEEGGGMEDDIAAGLEQLEEESQYDEEEEEQNSGPSNKKHRPDGDRSRSQSDPEPPKKPPTKSRPKMTKARISMHETLDEDGLRRSKRRRYPPLEFWRQERVVWGRRETGRSVVPVIKEIITIPKPPAEPLRARKRKRGTTRPPPRSKSKSFVSPGPPAEEIRIVEVDNPEQGWDDETGMHGVVVDWNTGTDVERRVAFTSRMLNPKVAANSNYMFQKVFGDNDFIAAGQILIPPGEQKPAKPAKDNTYVFYLIEGAVQFKVHRSSFIIATGGMFLVPRGNQYYIENICERDAKLFFAQARKIPERESDVASNVRSRVSVPPRARTVPHSPSRSVPSPTHVSATKNAAQVSPEKL